MRSESADERRHQPRDGSAAITGRARTSARTRAPCRPRPDWWRRSGRTARSAGSAAATRSVNCSTNGIAGVADPARRRDRAGIVRGGWSGGAGDGAWRRRAESRRTSACAAASAISNCSMPSIIASSAKTAAMAPVVARASMSRSSWAHHHRSKNTVSRSPWRWMSNVHVAGSPACGCASKRLAPVGGHERQHPIDGQRGIAGKVQPRVDVPQQARA